MHSLAVIIPAAGSGTRIGSPVPKPFLKIGDRTILEHTVKAFAGLSFVRQLIVPVHADWIEPVKDMLSSFSTPHRTVTILEGGNERQFSIQNGLSAVNEQVSLVAVHDAVRPFIDHAVITRCCELATQNGGAIVAVPAKDTIKMVDHSRKITETPDRRLLWQAQTPQIFQKKLLQSAYSSALSDGFVGTDDASLVERIGGNVYVVEGDRSNLKITYPIDLKVAEMIIKDREI